jgi:putative phosphoesterase
MTHIGLLSDTHGYLDDNMLRHFDDCDEIWHAGDFGTMEVAERLAALKPLKGVYGNIDGGMLRKTFPEHLRFKCEDVDVWMTHIGGYPGKYNPAIRQELYTKPPGLFICGHSHILKIIFDQKLKCLCINPGAAGKQGWQKVRTLIKFYVSDQKIHNLEAVELLK